MYDNNFYVGFTAFVQVAVVFDFGLLFLYQNNRSIFKSLFDRIRKGGPFSWIVGYAKENVKNINTKDVSAKTNEQRARVQQGINVFLSPAKYEYMCDYLAVTGIISGFYSILWLLFVPWSVGHANHSEDIYLTFSLATVIAEIIAIVKVFCPDKERPTRASLFLFSLITFVLCSLCGWILMRNGFVIVSTCPFNKTFFFSLLIAYGPICIYTVHLVITVIHRLIRLFSLWIIVHRLKQMIKK